MSRVQWIMEALTLSMRHRLGSRTVDCHSWLSQGKQLEFPVGEIPVEQYSCKTVLENCFFCYCFWHIMEMHVFWVPVKLEAIQSLSFFMNDSSLILIIYTAELFEIESPEFIHIHLLLFFVIVVVFCTALGLVLFSNSN